MFVHAFVAVVRASPEPSVFAILNGIDEEFAYFVGGGFGVAVLIKNYLSQFLCRSSGQQVIHL